MTDLGGVDKYEVLEKIGHGSFGIIRKVKRRSDGHILCRKEINYIRMSQKEREQLHAEFSILSSLRHPNIVAYYHREHLKQQQDLHLYMEYCGGGDLGKVIKDLQAKNQYAEEDFVWSIFAQIVTALYRCHYGVDAPEVGKNIMVHGNHAKPGLRTKNSVMILHRDLKPENVFLGADNSVKLGDFGLSKLMQSHDFASTYVGTPFYMSPEICAAERYTLQSDIWSLGCIIYELCARTPPFNARTHFHLVQKIKAGIVDPLPSVYSPELQSVIKSCLKTNPLTRPDTASLVQLPMVRLMRKEREVVELGQVLRSKEEMALQKTAQLELRTARLDVEKEKAKSDIESTIRLEWEVKARLEIDRQVQLETEKLNKKFEQTVQSRVEIEVQKHLRSLETIKERASSSPIDIPQSSVSTSNDTDFPSTTDLSSLSIESPLSQRSQKLKLLPPKKSTRTPFARARTQYDSPMDVQMAEPSPMSIASLSLSPRRTAAMAAASKLHNAKNIFAAAADQRAKWEPQLPASPLASDDEEDDEFDEITDLPSPTRPSRLIPTGVPDPFKVPLPKGRPGLLRQNTAPMQKHNTQASLFSTDTSTTTAAITALNPPLPSTTQQQQPLLHRAPGKPISPNRRLSKLSPSIASDSNLKPTNNDSGSPIRRAPSRPSNMNIKANKPSAGGDEMFKAVVQRNMLGAGTVNPTTNVNGNINLHPTAAVAATTGGGRTLIELAQARAGGNLGAARVYGDENFGLGGGIAAGVRGPGSKDSGVGMLEASEAPMWDPEIIDEMPSPFLRRGRGGNMLGVGR